MSSSSRIALFLLALAACGKSPEGTTVEGAVGEVAFQDPIAIYYCDEKMFLRDQITVLISDDPKACEHLIYDGDATRPYLLLPEGGHAPSLWLDMVDHNDLMTSMRGVGEDLKASFDPGAAAGTDCGSVACQSAWLAPKTGSANILSTNSPKEANAYAKGDFHLTFPEGSQLSGTFVATPCKELKSQGCGCDVGPTALAPGLALLLLGTLRRRRPQ